LGDKQVQKISNGVIFRLSPSKLKIYNRNQLLHYLTMNTIWNGLIWITYIVFLIKMQKKANSR